MLRGVSSQVEDISDPYTDDDNTSFTNIVGVTIFWNVISCTTAAFVYYFDVMAMDKRAIDGSSGDSEKGGGSSSSTSYASNAYFFVLSFLGLMWPIVSLAFFHGATQSAIFIAFSIVFYVITMVLHGMRGEGQDLVEGYEMYPTRKKIVFWLGYILTTPAVLMACNMLMQRRDVLYNFTTVFMVVVIGLCSMASEMIYTSYEIFYIKMHGKKEQGIDGLVDMLDESITNYKACSFPLTDQQMDQTSAPCTD